MGLEHLRGLDLNTLVGCRLTAQEAYIFLVYLNNILDTIGTTELPELWRVISKCLLHPEHPFELHQLLFQITYHGWNAASLGPPPVWIPTPQGAASTNTARFMDLIAREPTWRRKSPTGNPLSDWPLLYQLSTEAPEVFWPYVLRVLRIKFHSPPTSVLEIPNPIDPDSVRWLPGSKFNIAESALSGFDPDRPAILWAAEDSPTTIHCITRMELAREAQHVANALRAWSLQPGDAVAVDMPMVPEAVAAFLGIILAGCVAVSIADSFVPREIESRLRIARAKAIFTQDVVLRGGKALPLYSRVVEAGAPKAIVLPAGKCNRCELRQGDLIWDSFLNLAPPPIHLHAHSASADDISGILFSSGTTGEPKAIPWTHVTPIRCGADAFFHQDVRAEDAVCWPTSIGWMMGPWLVYACLLNGAAMALFAGSPLGRPFGQFIAAARVAVLGLVPSVARAWKATGCMKGLDWRCLRCFSSTGEASAAAEYLWLSSLGNYCPVVEYCGGTEIGGGFLTGSMLQPQAPATFSTPTVGSRPVLLLGEGEVEVVGRGARVGEEQTGELALKVPQLGVSQRLLNASHHKLYYEGMPGPMLCRHGDEMQLLPGGYCKAHGRVDDTMNLGGIKVSSVELERAVTAEASEVAEAAAVAVHPPDGGPDRLVLYLVVRDGSKKSENNSNSAELMHACQRAISKGLNPLFKVSEVHVVPVLPRTASNKVMRRVLRDQLEKKSEGEKLLVSKL